jgi:hypothetical protein
MSTRTKGASDRGLHLRATMLAFASSIFLAALLLSAAPARAQKKDYLSDSEADKIRDSDTPKERIKLFVSFAGDRIKKLQYEMTHPGDSLHRADRLNALINGYAGCIDDASDLIELGVEKQQDIRDAIKEMQARAPEFLAYLKDLQTKSGETADFKDNLDDAVDATSDAIQTAKEAEPEVAPPPARRRPQ